MRTSWDSSPSSSSADENEELTPTQLLSLAIKKRRSLYDSKDRDYRRELLHTGMIQSLCKFLGEGRAMRRRQKRKRSRSQVKSNAITNNGSNQYPASGQLERPMKRPCVNKDLPLRYQTMNNEILEPDSLQMDIVQGHTDLDGSDGVETQNSDLLHTSKPEPTMLEINGQPMDPPEDDAVVPSLKRPKYEQVFTTEPTEAEKEIIKEYVMEDFLSSFVSFYQPNEYYTSQSTATCGSSVEPTKDLSYWCSELQVSMLEDTDMDHHHPFDSSEHSLMPLPYPTPPNYDYFELLAFCS